MSLNFISSPTSAIQGEMQVPGDKSISHRSLIFGAIAKGITKVHGFLEGDDCLATLKAFQSMGVIIERKSDCLTIHGVGKSGLQAPKNAIDCGNSGTSMRLLAGLLAAQSFDSQLTGDASLLKRPMGRIQKPLLQMGAAVETQDGKPPIKIRGGCALTGIRYDMPEASAQVKSCILLAGLYAEGTTTVIEPAATRDHTEKMLKAFSYPIQKNGHTLSITSAGDCIATELSIPGDISSAAFFLVAASLVPDSRLLIRNVGINPTRTGIIAILKSMGANIELQNERLYGEEPVADILIQSAVLKGITISEALVPLAIDEFPVIFIAAACAKGTTVLRGAKELRSKESDRILAMVIGLNTLGIKAEALEDGVRIEGGLLQGGVVECFHDHRIAMAFAIAGAVAKAAIHIKGCENVATSFPNFAAIARSVNLTIKEYSDE